MRLFPVSGLLGICLLNAVAAADVLRGSAWLQSSQSTGVGIARLDVDDEGGNVSVSVDLQGLSGPVLGGRLIGPSGEVLCALTVQVGSPDVVFGTSLLAPADITKIALGQTLVWVDTLAHPQGEIGGAIAPLFQNYSFPMTTAQLSPIPASAAGGNGFVSFTAQGEVGFSGQLQNLQGVPTSIEVRRGAWYGQSGTLLLTITSVGFPIPALTTYFGTLPSTTPEERRDLADGMCYVIVRTAQFPGGELRGQIRSLELGDAYCLGRPSSASVGGALVQLTGSPLASANDLHLRGYDLPPGKLVLPIIGFGSGHVFSPGGRGGMLCVAGAGVGRLSSALTHADSQGFFNAQLDLSNFKVGSGTFSALPGMRVYLQLWYRDPQGPTPSNFSSAVTTVFH